ncbi:MAG: phage terminase large subunit [Candidatus Moranbacteria bacterium]|nr:phage terminase large subunit [Candidatus Moranbacteria bacterium]
MTKNKTAHILSTSLVKKMMKDRAIRTSISKESFLYFFHFYYAHYVKYETADFQKELFHLLESNPKENLYVVAFRGSGKSTIITTAYPLWAILGKQQKKFCVIFTQTRVQAKQHMMNIRTELESNELLKRDLGPFKEESDEWGSFSLVFKKHNARITVASTEQSIRGIRHNEHRPDLLICDDVEDVQSTKTREGREKTYNWLRGEVIPTGDRNTRLIIVGNLLHEDSLLMKIKTEVVEGRSSGVFKQYPLLDRNDYCLWKGKYPDENALEEEKKKVGSEVSWQREYLLRIIPSDDQVIYPEWLQYYDDLPGENHPGYRGTYIGVDLAISSKEAADETAIVMAHVYSRSEKLRIYILPTVISKKLNFPAQVELIKEISTTHMRKQKEGEIFVESVAYQEALPQMLEHEGIKATAIKPKGDKRTRLSLTSTAIKSGLIKFPKQGCEDLIKQLIGFGIEKHDDIADAFSLLINALMAKHSKEGTILMMWVGRYCDESDIVYYNDYVDVE